MIKVEKEVEQPLVLNQTTENFQEMSFLVKFTTSLCLVVDCFIRVVLKFHLI